MPITTFPGRPLASYPILSIFYKVLYASTIAARLPFWILGYGLFRRLRPLSTWSFRQALMVKIFSEFVFMISRTETPQSLTLKPGREKERFVKLEPFAGDCYRGPLASEEVKPEVIGGTWYPRQPDGFNNGGMVLLHVHGGGFVLGDGRDAATGPMADLLMKHGKLETIFAPQYRLSSKPTLAPFPAALQDTLTAYLYLVRTLNIPADRICVSGDSAGGNLVIGLLRYLVEHGAALGIPQPRSAVVVAPWVAPGRNLGPRIAVTSNPYYATDYLGAELTRWGARTYIRTLAMGRDPYVSPLGRPFATPVPVLVTLGAAEILAVDGRDWVREMRRVDGNVVEVYEEPGAPHDTLLVGNVLGFEESAQEVARRIGVFVRRFS